MTTTFFGPVKCYTFYVYRLFVYSFEQFATSCLTWCNVATMRDKSVETLL